MVDDDDGSGVGATWWLLMSMEMVIDVDMVEVHCPSKF